MLRIKEQAAVDSQIPATTEKGLLSVLPPCCVPKALGERCRVTGLPGQLVCLQQRDIIALFTSSYVLLSLWNFPALLYTLYTLRSQ